MSFNGMQTVNGVIVLVVILGIVIGVKIHTCKIMRQALPEVDHVEIVFLCHLLGMYGFQGLIQRSGLGG